MKVLVIIAGHEMSKNDLPNIEILNNYLINRNFDFDYCAISNTDDFINFESIISFKYKEINQKKQLSKICDFISKYKNELDYDWYIKIRPDVKLLEEINFDILLDNAINGRARHYRGPKKIKYGMSVNGPGRWQNVGDCVYSNKEELVILDDQIFIFHKNIIVLGGFDIVEPNYDEGESHHSNIWISRGIGLNVIGILIHMTKYDCYSGNLNL